MCAAGIGDDVGADGCCGFELGGLGGVASCGCVGFPGICNLMFVVVCGLVRLGCCCEFGWGM